MKSAASPRTPARPALRARASPATSGAAGSHALHTPHTPRALDAARATAACACGGGCPRCVQAKLKLDTPGDRWEQEAERVADAVSAGAALAPQQTGSAPGLQRVSGLMSPEAEDAVHGAAQPGDGVEDDLAADGAGPPAVQRLQRPAQAPSAPGSAWAAQLGSSAGQALPAPLAADLGQRIGADFSTVRVHADAQAAQLCDGVGARAFAHGRHLYFNRGEYRPYQRDGLRVLAHELAHVVQQGAAGAPPVQQGAAAAPPVQRMAALDRSSPATLHDADVQPWSDQPDARGDEYVVKTDAGSPVTAWVAYNSVPADKRYWCHGFSLGTYARWGYSVYSGSQMQRVVNDEYRRIPREQARAGDLAVWVLMPDGRLYGHSARFTQPVLRDGNLDTVQSRLDTKNGYAALANRTLAEIMAVSIYGYNVAVYRHA